MDYLVIGVLIALAILTVTNVFIVAQLGAQRILLVALVKQVRMATLMMEQDDRFDAGAAGDRAQFEIDVVAGKHW